VTDIKLYISVFLLSIFSLVSAQRPNLDDLSPRQLRKFALNAERAGDDYTALYFYEAYYKRKKNDVESIYRMAELYLKTRDYKDAEKYFGIVAEKNNVKYPKAQFYHAEMLRATGQYEEAYEGYRQFRRSYKGEKESKEYRKLARYGMQSCEVADSLIEYELKVSIEQLSSSVNGAHIEFSPIPYNDTTLLYGALLLDSVVFFNTNNIDSVIPRRQFYMATKEGLDWIGRKEFPLPFNDPTVNVGNGAFSKDGKRFYFTKCEPNWQNKMICHIYRSEYKAGRWTEPEALPENINDPNYTSTHPTLSVTAKHNREIIYFASDRPEGKGGMDLWYTVYNPRKEIWKDPKNMGSKINTPGDEITPFYENITRTLYFSSTGLPGLGGLDVFHGMGERRKFTPIQNIGYPINSGYDDLYFTVSKERDHGFFTSNRPGIFYINNETCCDDIYYYRWLDFIRLGATGTVYPLEKDRFGRKKDYSNFDFMNPSDTIQPIEGTVIALYLKDEVNNELIFMERDTTDENGKYFFNLLPEKNYQFFVEGFQYFNEEVFLSTEGINFSFDIEMPPIWINVLTDKPIVLEDILYDFNSAELSQNAKNIIDTTLLILLTEAPEFIIEIGSHTDTIGTAKDNLELSQERAQSVVEYLITKGIDEERLVARGYGSSNPIAPNFKPDGSDNPIGREKNRRTEFKIVGSLLELEEDDDDDFN
jgi:OOP family OmpA-OmpF porin